MGCSRKNAKAPSRAKRLRNAWKETAAKQQYCAIHLLDVQEHENAAGQELHLDPVVHERENAARRDLHQPYDYIYLHQDTSIFTNCIVYQNPTWNPKGAITGNNNS
jgi:hypothetical protein